MWTTPIIVENGSKSSTINGLLDDESTQAYLNADIAANYGLHREIHETQVNVINGTVAPLKQSQWNSH